MLDREGPVHLYVQIADQLRAQIDSGDLAPGSAVPSEKDLAEKYGVTRRTVRRAILELRHEGRVYSAQGQGTYVGPEDAPRVPREIPVYQQVAEAMAAQIRAGDYKPNRPIPSEAHMSQQFGVANGTVREAVRHLRELGWVQTVPRKGTYVVPREDWPRS